MAAPRSAPVRSGARSDWQGDARRSMRWKSAHTAGNAWHRPITANQNSSDTDFSNFAASVSRRRVAERTGRRVSTVFSELCSLDDRYRIRASEVWVLQFGGAIPRLTGLAARMIQDLAIADLSKPRRTFENAITVNELGTFNLSQA